MRPKFHQVLTEVESLTVRVGHSVEPAGRQLIRVDIMEATCEAKCDAKHQESTRHRSQPVEGPVGDDTALPAFVPIARIQIAQVALVQVVHNGRH